MLYLDISKIPKTLSESEIFSVIVDWSIFDMYHLPGPLHPPNWVGGGGGESGGCPLHP